MSSHSATFEVILKRIRSKLPIQNPLHSFVHNNILQMFEEQEFHQALHEASRIYRARAYWPVNQYVEKYRQGKISDKDINEGILQYSLHFKELELATELGLDLSQFYHHLMFSQMLFNDDMEQPEIGDDTLWQSVLGKMQSQTLEYCRTEKKYRAKDYWEKYFNESFSASAHPYVIKLISSYLDQGQSFWSNPFSKQGLWAFFLEDVKIIGHFGEEWQRILKDKLLALVHLAPAEIIEHQLKLRQLPEEAWESFLLELLFDLKGWSGMVNKLETEPWQATVHAPQLSLIDFIAILILIEDSLDEYFSKTHSIDLAMIYGRCEIESYRGFQLSLALFQIMQDFNLKPDWLETKSSLQLVELVRKMMEAEQIHLERLWHEAYEQHFYREALTAIMGHRPQVKSLQEWETQILFCIDDREESIRRHLEEVNPKIKTFGVVGFFGIDMKFSSVKHKRLIAQCPPVINPSRIVKEVARDSNSADHFFKLNDLKGEADLSLYYSSRTLFRGFFATLALGIMSLAPMFLQVFFPQQGKRLRENIFNWFSKKPATDLSIELTEEGHGYSKKEMRDIVASILKMCGLSRTFTPLVLLIGHGSTSNNNPFRQAYGCGACGGNAGIPNSRAFAKMVNDPEVRSLLKEQDIFIPDTTYFVSGFHDTCTDEILFFDLEFLPSTHLSGFEKVKSDLVSACRLNAFERCQRFTLPDAHKTPEKALQHVRERAEDPAQPRPEYGHSTNALAIVGPRALTRGLFMNRRSFLLTYDWQRDTDGEILKQVVLGGIPVAVNINMDYYFSCVDNDNFGCGSKLPLNLTSLLGVMTGSSSDLRIGLARQMVEIHEPIRNMTIINAPLERVKNIFYQHPRLKKLLFNHWMRLVVNDPATGQWFIFREDDFQLLTAEPYQLRFFKSSLETLAEKSIDQDFAEIT